MRLAALPILVTLPAAADVPSVVADIPPVQSIVAAVMEGRGEPTLMMPAGTDPHSHSLRPSEAQALQDAGLVVIVGEALTPWIAEPLEALAGDATVLEMLEIEGLDLIEVDGEDAHDEEDHDGHDHGDEDHAEGDAHDHDHGEEQAEAHDDHDHGDHAGHDHGPLDPHAWLDPAIAATFADAVAATLSDMDPDGRETYEANAAAFAERMATLTPPAVGPAVWIAGHDAYAYAARWIGAPDAGAVTDVDNITPGAATLAELTETASDAVCIIAPPLSDERLMGAVGDLPVIELDPLGADLEPGPGLYPALIEAVGAAFGDCLSR